MWLRDQLYWLAARVSLDFRPEYILYNDTLKPTSAHLGIPKGLGAGGVFGACLGGMENKPSVQRPWRGQLLSLREPKDL